MTFDAVDVLLLGEVTSPGNFRYDRIVKHRDYAAGGIPFSLRVDLESGKEAVEATLFELADGEYREATRSVDGVLRSSVPWPFEADLRALATGPRGAEGRPGHLHPQTVPTSGSSRSSTCWKPSDTSTHVDGFGPASVCATTWSTSPPATARSTRARAAAVPNP